MIEKIEIDKILYAIIIRTNYKSEKGIEFFTPNNFSQQLAYMKRPTGYEIKPHTHKKIMKQIEFTQEVLFIKSFGDHRIAMSFSILNILCNKKLQIDNKRCINISYPDFEKHLNYLL